MKWQLKTPLERMVEGRLRKSGVTPVKRVRKPKTIPFTTGFNNIFIDEFGEMKPGSIFHWSFEGENFRMEYTPPEQYDEENKDNRSEAEKWADNWANGRTDLPTDTKESDS